MACWRSATQVNTPRRMRRRVMTEKKFQTALIQDVEVGVKRIVTLGERDRAAHSVRALAIDKGHLAIRLGHPDPAVALKAQQKIVILTDRGLFLLVFVSVRRPIRWAVHGCDLMRIDRHQREPGAAPGVIAPDHVRPRQVASLRRQRAGAACGRDERAGAREIDVVPEGQGAVELAAILVLSTAEASELDAVIAALERSAAVKSATWTVGTTS